MLAHGAHFGGLQADDDVTAVAALPDGLAVTGEHHAVLDVLEQGQVALLVLLLNGAYLLKQEGDMIEAYEEVEVKKTL